MRSRYPGIPRGHDGGHAPPRGSVAVQFPQPRTQAKEPLHPLDFVEHLPEDLPNRIIRGLGDHGCIVAERFPGHRAIPAEGSISEAGAGMVVLGHEPGHWNPVPVIDPVGDDQVRELFASRNETEFNEIDQIDELDEIDFDGLDIA